MTLNLSLELDQSAEQGPGHGAYPYPLKPYPGRQLRLYYLLYAYHAARGLINNVTSTDYALSYSCNYGNWKLLSTRHTEWRGERARCHAKYWTIEMPRFGGGHLVDPSYPLRQVSPARDAC